MILHGNQRGGARDLALHLLSNENDHVDVHELRGFVADDLQGSLHEAYAMSKATKAKQFLYSLSLNPPQEAEVSTLDFESAINRAEKTLGLNGQPRAVVFHEKKGRRHCHVVWSRTNTDTMTAVPLPHTKRKLMELSKELYIEHGWEMPKGMQNSELVDKRNFTLSEWQQAKRIGKDPRTIKQAFQDSWALSDDQKSFTLALKERGYVLARGDRRGFVAVDRFCEVYAVPKWVGIKTKDVKAKLGNEKQLPSVSEAKQTISTEMVQRLSEIGKEQDQRIGHRLHIIGQKRESLLERHRSERAELKKFHEKRQLQELQARQARFRKGLRGFFDRFTGQRKKTTHQNKLEASTSITRDQNEKDNLILTHLKERNALDYRKKRLQEFRLSQEQTIKEDVNKYQSISNVCKRNDIFEFKL